MYRTVALPDCPFEYKIPHGQHFVQFDSMSQMLLRKQKYFWENYSISRKYSHLPPEKIQNKYKKEEQWEVGDKSIYRSMGYDIDVATNKYKVDNISMSPFQGRSLGIPKRKRWKNNPEIESCFIHDWLIEQYVGIRSGVIGQFAGIYNVLDNRMADTVIKSAQELNQVSQVIEGSKVK